MASVCSFTSNSKRIFLNWLNDVKLWIGWWDCIGERDDITQHFGLLQKNQSVALSVGNIWRFLCLQEFLLHFTQVHALFVKELRWSKQIGWRGEQWQRNRTSFISEDCIVLNGFQISNQGRNVPVILSRKANFQLQRIDYNHPSCCTTGSILVEQLIW